jgi:hypothetical protein
MNAPPKAGAKDKDLTFSSHTTLKIDEAKEVSSSGMGLGKAIIICLNPYNQPPSRWAQARMIGSLHHVSANDNTLFYLMLHRLPFHLILSYAAHDWKIRVETYRFAGQGSGSVRHFGSHCLIIKGKGGVDTAFTVAYRAQHKELSDASCKPPRAKRGKRYR